jgi:neutral ceramidase
MKRKQRHLRGIVGRTLIRKTRMQAVKHRASNQAVFQTHRLSLLIGGLIIVAVVGTPLWAQDADAGAGQAQRVFRAGAAVSNITPPLGELIVGGWSPYPATHVHDDLHARCLVLDDGTTKLAIVLCDNVGIPESVFNAAKKKIHEETGLPVEHMLMAATHTHSATNARGTNRYDLDAPLEGYQIFLAERVADGVRRALKNLEPACVGWGTADEPSQVFNRRWFMAPGPHLQNPFGGQDKVRMNPPRGDAALLRPAGPTDPEVAFLSVQATDGRPMALLVNYSLHYVGGVRSGEISADYFAMFADRMQELFGADRLDPPFVGIMSNGTSGNINNVDFRERSPQRYAPYEKMRMVANLVADKVYQAHQQIEFHDWVPLAAEQTELPLTVRKPTSEQYSWAEQVLAETDNESSGHRRARIYAERFQQLRHAPDEVAAILQAFRVGDLGIAAIPFEVFVESGLEIKEKSPLKQTFTISLANGWYGYLPTPEHHEWGGYETWLGTNIVQIDASTKIVEALLNSFERLVEMDKPAGK